MYLFIDIIESYFSINKIAEWRWNFIIFRAI